MTTRDELRGAVIREVNGAMLLNNEAIADAILALAGEAAVKVVRDEVLAAQAYGLLGGATAIAALRELFGAPK